MLVGRAIRSGNRGLPCQLIAELESLIRRGWKDAVFIVDDNFIGNKRLAKELLQELIAWRRRTQPNIGFLTEASVNLADDPDCARSWSRPASRKFSWARIPC
jgi:radical SAM superfamily enzyme YgiQ (UPF0313 family)